MYLNGHRIIRNAGGTPNRSPPGGNGDLFGPRIPRCVVVILWGLLGMLLGLLVLGVILLSALFYDAHRVASKACRVRPGNDAVAASIESHFTLTPYYSGRLVEKVRFVPYLLLTRRLPRFAQEALFNDYLMLFPSARVSVIATYAPFDNRPGESVVGMDRAAIKWLGKDWSQVKEADIAELRKHLYKGGRRTH
jgi:hypothetical protein